ncbi:MAG TPA: class A beta-lactamase [Candidatus Acidoferrum sp.]|nr:class A beta-lactamase [Candidatus Acidoferrum sp.]
MRPTLFAALVLTLFSPYVCSQTLLQDEIRKIAAEAHGKVSVSCSLPGSALNCDLEPHAHPPMQSVFKLPLALCMFSQIEQGKFSLDQPIRFLPSDRFFPKTYSPLQDKYADANVDVLLRELLRLAVSLSDNVAADIVLRLVGGPAVVDAYIKSIGVEGFHLEDSEHALHRDPTAQYRNWFEPAGAVQLLRRIGDNSPFTPEHTELLLTCMEDSPTGPNRLKGALPSGTVVMHKTGSSGTQGNKTPATNDIGLIVLPDGRRLAIAVFITDASADSATIESVIARIAAAAYAAAPR